MGLGSLDNLLNRLVRQGNILVDQNFSTETVGPSVIQIEGKEYFRFMDYFYISKPPSVLDPLEIVEICDLRLDYLEKVVNLNLNRSIVQYMASHIETGLTNQTTNYKRGLDFGCGSGISLTLIKQCLADVVLQGVDLSKKAVDLARNNGHEVELVSLEKPFPFPDENFDFVIAVFVMHFSVDPSSILEIYRVLMPGGLFLYNFYNTEPRNSQISLSNAGFSDRVILPNGDLPTNHFIAVCVK